MRRLDLEGMEHLAHALAKEMMNWDEPIPPFRTRFPGILEACIEVPFATFDGKDLYPELVDKAAILFYVMIKNHPFQNGNKRIAVTALLVFLYNNGLWLHIRNEKMYELAMFIARTKPEDKDIVVSLLQGVLTQHIRPN